MRDQCDYAVSIRPGGLHTTEIHNGYCACSLTSTCADCTQEEKAQREQKKSHMARLVLGGQSSFTSDDSDVFEGLSPHEVQAFVDEVCSAAVRMAVEHLCVQGHWRCLLSLLRVFQTTGGAKAADPFEGMSPDEINAFIASNNQHLTAHS